MIPIVSIVGKSNTGKTYLVERLLPALTRRGYRIATVKHDVHGFEMDREGKDSWRHKQAGASTVVLSSPEKIAVIKDLQDEQTLDTIRMKWITDADLILTEGYKRSRHPKIEVSLFNQEQELICTKKDDRLFAVVSNKTLSVDVPLFRETEIERLADLLEERFLGKARSAITEIFIQGKQVALNPFVQEIVWKMVRALLSSLKGCNPEGKVEIRLAGEEPGGETAGGDRSDHETGTANGSKPD